MSTFREFLEKQAGQLAIEESKAARMRDEWIEAVERLKALVRGWLAEDDPGGMLAIEDLPPSPFREEGIGTYEVGGLAIILGVREAQLKPVARRVARPYTERGGRPIRGAFGRVDLTNGLEKYLIFREQMQPEDSWLICDQDEYVMHRLDRGSFEAALQRLLE